jgi:hypothetical protein
MPCSSSMSASNSCGGHTPPSSIVVASVGLSPFPYTCRRVEVALNASVPQNVALSDSKQTGSQ